VTNTDGHQPRTVPQSTGFSVAARTILELGAELISSDGVALYELVKNAYDAGSKRANIVVTSVFKFSALRSALQRINLAILARQKGESEQALLANARAEIIRGIDPTALQEARSTFLDSIDGSTLEELAVSLRAAYDAANELVVADSGDGMSLEQLTEIFLTIGTRSRLEAPQPSKHYAGGKGLGRLAAMRLGDKLEVRSTKSGEDHWNVLEIDWTLFSHDSNAMIDEIKFTPRLGAVKDDPLLKGTEIVIRSLKADWDIDRVRRLAEKQFDRLFDPFGSKPRYPIIIKVNTNDVQIPTFDKRILQEAQAKGKISYFTDPPRAVFDIEYIIHNKNTQILYDRDDLLGMTSKEEISTAAMDSLGPFEVHFHWFNRQRLKAIEGFGDRDFVRDSVNQWANGLLMYRDGLRVNPYGAPDDDWLGLDQRALGASGYKINRKQIIGAVNISAEHNPYLIDQTNREGLRNTEEKALLVILLQKAITEDLRRYLNEVDREIKKSSRLSTKDTTAFLDSVTGKVKRTLKALTASAPSEQKPDLAFLESTFVELEQRLRTAKDAIATAERDQRDMVNLAGIGLLVEIVSHELGRVTRRTLDLLASTDRTAIPKDVAATFDSVESQMLIIRRRLDLLDPLSPSGRNVRERFDLVQLLTQVLDSHAAQFERYRISPNLVVRPSSRTSFEVKAVKGMIVQVLENLIDNSVFWLRQRSRSEPNFAPEVSLILDTSALELQITDNGPGISRARSEEVFKPFFSSKPPGEGKGLGLYIAKEIARHHGSDLYLLDDPNSEKLNTFVLDIDGLQ